MEARPLAGGALAHCGQRCPKGEGRVARQRLNAVRASGPGFQAGPFYDTREAIMTFKNVHSARRALRCIPGNGIRDFWGMPLTGESAPAVAAAKVLHKQAPALAAANRLPKPGDLPRRFRMFPWHISRRTRKRVVQWVRCPAEGMAGALRRGDLYWHWAYRFNIGGPPGSETFDPWSDRVELPVSARSYGWALANPRMLALASRDLLWRAIVLHYLWLLSGRPSGGPEGPDA
jgi:hypothetical protein